MGHVTSALMNGISPYVTAFGDFLFFYPFAMLGSIVVPFWKVKVCSSKTLTCWCLALGLWELQNCEKYISVVCKLFTFCILLKQHKGNRMPAFGLVDFSVGCLPFLSLLLLSFIFLLFIPCVSCLLFPTCFLI